MTELKPRERVLLALDRKETDRVPVDFLATPEVWAALERYLGVSGHELVLQVLGADLRHPRQPYAGPALERFADGTWRDAWGVVRRMVPNEFGAYEEIARHPLAGDLDMRTLAEYPWPRPEWWDADALAAAIPEDYAIALEEFGDPGGMFEIAWYLRGFEQFLADVMERPELACEIMRRVTDFYIGMLDRVMAACPGRIDLVWTSDDVAHQRGSLMSIRTWREAVAPHHERLNRRIHEHGARVMYHCCGAVRPFLPGLVEIGVDVLDVLQFSARGMDPAEIKQSFGGALCFHGGVDVQTTLPRGTPESVRAEVRARIDVLGKGGGYILSPAHNIQPDTPPANIVAMYAEAGSIRKREALLPTSYPAGRGDGK
ncbi:MAG: uroporphyrinogen decarboxylase family protein [Acidobacteriota bacterium]